jgi:protein SCO1
MQNILLKVGMLALLFCVASVPAIADNLTIGDKVPDFTLTNHNGTKTSLSDFRGRGVILSFLYTQCPDPQKCPMIRKKLSNLAELSDKIDETDLQVLAITIDPKNDTPEVLKSYAQGFEKQHDNWLFLTGSEEDIARIAGAFGVLYWDEQGAVQHNMRTIFVDPDQIIQIVKSGSDWKPGQFAAEIVHSLK